MSQDVLNIMGALYAATLFLGVSNASTVQPVFSVERGVMYRERAAGMYSVFCFGIAKVILQLYQNPLGSFPVSYLLSCMHLLGSQGTDHLHGSLRYPGYPGSGPDRLGNCVVMHG